MPNGPTDRSCQNIEPAPEEGCEDAYDIARAVQEVMVSYPEVKAIGLFGSFARGEQGHVSDVDLLVSIEDGRETWPQRRSMQEDLETALGRDVDLITSLRGLEPFFMDELERDTVRIYER